MESEITYELLKAAAARADQSGDSYSGRILLSMSEKIMKWGKLTPRQTDFARNLIERTNPEAAEEKSKWVDRVKGDEELQERIQVIANYYSNTTYFSATCGDCLSWLEHKRDKWLPSERSINKMIYNDYSDKVWASHKGKQIWNVGDLVQVRQNAAIQYRHITPNFWQHRNDYREWVWMIAEVGSRPIDRSITYDEKKGGGRYYRLLRLGGTQQIDVIECELKKVPKKLLK
tara:strand:+ start:97 stop:789 length:693 start_codon:yes stop_codon:yes gene_type:complete